MGIFSKIKKGVSSKANAALDKAIDPAKELEMAIMELEEGRKKALAELVTYKATAKNMERDLEKHRAKVAEWERRAMLAVRAGDDSLARQALIRKQEHENISAQFQQQWIAQKAAVDKLKDALRLLANKIEEAKRKKNILIARKKRAEAQRQIANTMQGLGDTSAFETFDRMAEKITMLEAEAEAGAELAGEISGDTLESKFLALESGGHGTEDDALAELKAKMGLLESGNTTSTPQLAAKSSASLSEEDLKELEDLDLSGLDVDSDDEKPEASSGAKPEQKKAAKSAAAGASDSAE